jgi:hypothetical protein
VGFIEIAVGSYWILLLGLAGKRAQHRYLVVYFLHGIVLLYVV